MSLDGFYRRLGGILADNMSEEKKEWHTEGTLGEAMAILEFLLSASV